MFDALSLWSARFRSALRTAVADGRTTRHPSPPQVSATASHESKIAVAWLPREMRLPQSNPGQNRVMLAPSKKSSDFWRIGKRIPTDPLPSLDYWHRPLSIGRNEWLDFQRLLCRVNLSTASIQ